MYDLENVLFGIDQRLFDVLKPQYQKLNRILNGNKLAIISYSSGLVMINFEQFTLTEFEKLVDDMWIKIGYK